MDEHKPLTPVVRFNGDPLEDDLERSMRSLQVELSVRRPGIVRLVYEDPTRGLFSQLPFGVSDRLEVLMPGRRNDLVKVFSGEITGLGVHDAQGLSEVRVEAHDVGHRFALSSRVTAHLDKSAIEVVRDIARDHGLVLETTLASDTESWLLQRGTDFAFLNEVAMTHGAEWYVDGDVLHLVPERDEEPVKVSYETGFLRRFSANHTSSGVVSEVEVRGWDPASQSAIVANAPAEPREEHLGSGAGFVSSQFLQGQRGWGQKVQISSIPVRTQAEADRVAAALAARWSAAGLSVEGEAFSTPELRPGRSVEIEGVAAPLTGTYRVTEVTHEFGPQSEVITSFVASNQAPFAFHGTTGDPAVGPDGWTGSEGLAIGVVTNINDPDGLGRVKVWLPTLGDRIESDWARVLVLGAGAGGPGGPRGLDILPEINDEVLVAFEHGDPRFPVVLGGVYSGRNPPYDTASTVQGSKVTRRMLRTRSGHRLVFSDVDDDQAQMSISLLLADDKTKLEVRQDGITVEAASGKPIKLVSGRGSITITESGNVELAGQDITIKATGKVNVEGSQFGAKATLAASIDGGSKLEAKAATVEVNGASMTQIKGAMVKIN